MGLRFDPIGGGQLKQVVQQMIEAESIPLKAVAHRKSKIDARAKLLGELEAKFFTLDKAVAELSTFKKMRELKVDLGEGANLVSVTIDKEQAEPCQHDLQINALAKKSSFMSVALKDETQLLGEGTILLRTVGGVEFEYSISEKNSSLQGIASVINNTPFSPMTAALVPDETEDERLYRMIFTSRKDNSEDQIDEINFDFNVGDLDIDTQEDYQKAEIIVDNFSIQFGGNDIKNFLPGVNIHLKQANENLPFTLTISEDYQKIAGKIKHLIEQLNGVLQFIYKQNAIDDKTDTTVTFAGDSSLQMLEYRLRKVVHQPYDITTEESENNEFISLSEMGVEFDRSGTLQFKEDKFIKSLEKNFRKISRCLTGEKSFGDELAKVVASSIRAADGILTTKKKGIKAQMRDLDQQLEDKTRILEKKKQDLVDKFARLEATLGGLQRQQQSVSAALGAPASVGALLG